ncbi:hypothetical protein P389DRAFT_167463 [Cystobasidium minutum MCA 4210]|uniref:uncharacterized protein n=1 Tax=Cystobasidium minutum MCA 4210 TaxID=1397322 RepID=UPI0034CD6C96|eukprot:jgi/Rhomi1/167463/fgenesh1_kg.2_\
MPTLPLDLLLDVAVFLDTQDLLNASCVSKAWRTYITTTPRIWQHPHFHLSSNKHGESLFYTPSPSVLSRYLGDLPIRSLHLSGGLKQPEKTCSVQYLSRRQMETELEQLRELLPTSNDHRGLHIVLDHMPSKLLERLISAVREVFPVLDRLSIGTLPASADLAMIHHRVGCRWQHLKILGSCEIYPTSYETVGFDTMPASSVPEVATYEPNQLSNAPNRAAPYASGNFDRADPPNFTDLDEADGHVRCLSLFIPDELYAGWRVSDIGCVLFRGYQELAISGGSWMLDKPCPISTISGSGTLRSLKLLNLWKLLCSDHLRKYDNLASVQLSFHPQNKTKWKDISNLLSSVLGPQIEHIHIVFPRQPIDAVRHDHLDAVWRDRISQCYQLKELRLVNYIPSTLSAILDGDIPARSLEKLVFAKDILPRNFFCDFIPDKLPRLKLLDTSGAVFFRSRSPPDFEDWAKQWENAGIGFIVLA